MCDNDNAGAVTNQSLDADGNPIDASAQGDPNVNADPTNQPDLDHGESSRLGRRVSKMESMLDGFIEKMDAKFNQPNPYDNNQYYPQYDGGYQPQQQQYTGYDTSEIVSTVADVDRILDERDRKREDDNQRYTHDYSGAFDRMKGLDADNYGEIYDEMMVNFNEKRTGNPVIDAEYNYSRAARSVLSKKLASAKPAPNVLTNTALPTGVSASSTSAPASNAAPVHLDPIAKEFAEKIGMSEEDQKAALDGDASMGVKRPEER